MRPFGILFFCSLVLSFCQNNSQKAISDQNQMKQRIVNRDIQELPVILLTSGNKSEKFNNYIKNQSIKKVGFINDVQFLEKEKKYTFNLENLKTEIKRAYPKPSEEGVAYIDIEAPYLEYLMTKPTNSIEFIKSQKLFLDVLQIAKKERPNVKWGYYYIPFTTYWGRDKKFYEKHNKIKQIIEESDVLFPSIYIFYNRLNFDIENLQYVEENTKEVIRVAQLYNKEVYPLVMSRYHPSNASIGNEIIEPENFENYVKTIFHTTYLNRQVDGVLLWNADDYAFRIKEKKLLQELVKAKVDFNTYYDQHIIQYLDIMSKSRNIMNSK